MCFSCKFDGHSACWKKTRPPLINNWVKVEGYFSHVLPNKILGITITQILFNPTGSSNQQCGFDSSPSKKNKFNTIAAPSIAAIPSTSCSSLQMQVADSTHAANASVMSGGPNSFNESLSIPPCKSEMLLDAFVKPPVAHPADPTSSPGAGPSAKKKGKCKATDTEQ